MKSSWKKWAILVVAFSVVLLLEQYVIAAFGLQAMFNQNPIFAFIGPGAVSAAIFVGIDKYVLKMRAK